MELGHNRVWDYVGDNFVHRPVLRINVQPDTVSKFWFEIGKAFFLLLTI